MILRSYSLDFRQDAGCCHYSRPAGQRPVEITEENWTTFSDQPGQPRGMVLAIFYSFSEFPTWVKKSRTMNRLVKMNRKISVVKFRPGFSGLLPEVLPNIPVGRTLHRPFHLTSDRNLWHNGKHPPWQSRKLLINKTLSVSVSRILLCLIQSWERQSLYSNKLNMSKPTLHLNVWTFWLFSSV